MSLLLPLTKEQEEVVLADVNYTKKQLEYDLNQLRKWLHEQQHLPPSRLQENDNFLKSFLVGCKGSLQTAKRKLDGYYSFRTFTNLLENRDPLDGEYVVKNSTNYFCILPQLSKSKDVVFINEPFDTNSKTYDYFYLLKRIINMLEIKMRMTDNYACNIIFLIDAKLLTPGHIFLISPSLMREMLYLLQNILPFRVRAAIMVNAPTILDVAVNNLLKPLVPKKLKERLQIFTSGFEEYQKFVDKDILPVEYGGREVKTIKELNEIWKTKETEERNLFIKELSEHTDESKRIKLENNVINDDPYFGVHGSLKKLVID